MIKDAGGFGTGSGVVGWFEADAACVQWRLVEDRRQQLEGWCGAQLGPVLAFEALPAEASTRRFYRVRTRSGTRIAMDAPPATEDNPRFRRLSALFRAHGVAVPEVIAFDDRGFLLVTDFGDRLLSRVYAEGRADGALELALDTLMRIQAIPSAAVPAYTAQRFRDELEIFAEWLVGGLLGNAPPAFLEGVWRALVDAARAQPTVAIHRDYHSRNLLLRDDGELGVVDFQDALAGPVTYDLVSLLRDCYHVFSESVVAHWRTRYRSLADCGMDEAQFVRAFDLTGIQRHLKAAGIFARLSLRDGRGSHLPDVVPTLERVVAVGMAYPETRRLAEWLGNEILPQAAVATCAR